MAPESGVRVYRIRKCGLPAVEKGQDNVHLLLLEIQTDIARSELTPEDIEDEKKRKADK